MLEKVPKRRCFKQPSPAVSTLKTVGDSAMKASEALAKASFEMKKMALPKPRPCIVKGKNCLFHRWCDRENVIIKVNVMAKKEYIEGVRQTINQGNPPMIPAGFDAMPLKTTLAIVEHEDGSIETVNPEEVRFIDRGRWGYEN